MEAILFYGTLSIIGWALLAIREARANSRRKGLSDAEIKNHLDNMESYYQEQHYNRILSYLSGILGGMKNAPPELVGKTAEAIESRKGIKMIPGTYDFTYNGKVYEAYRMEDYSLAMREKADVK